MRTPHPDPHPAALQPRALPPGWLVAAVTLIPCLVASCGDNLAANCPPLAHPPILTAAAASNPCQANAGESAKLRELRVVQRYDRTQGRVPLTL